MAKPFRSPLVGYNHNLNHLGRVFHVQSEDSGPAMPRVFTHLFFEGTILVSRKQEYDANLPDDKVRALMQAQHKTVMKDLMQSRLNDRIITFFAARGVDLLPLLAQGAVPAVIEGAMPAVIEGAVPQVMQGAMPQAPHDVSAPVMVLPDVLAEAAAPSGVVASVPVAFRDDHRGDEARERDRGIPADGPRRTLTQPIEMAHRRGQTPPPVVVRSSEARRSPFVRSGTPVDAKMSSADGVVVQRNLVVGGASGSSARPSRIRPPVPYVVTGGGHTERPPKPAPAPAAVPPTVAAHLTSVPSPRPPSSPSSFPFSPLSPSPAPISAVESPRLTGGFSVGLADDKSLDEVILEYLSEDGD